MSKQQDTIETKEDKKAQAILLAQELGPQHFVNIKEIEETLIKKGDIKISQEYFSIKDMEYLRKACDLYKEYPALREMLKDEVNFLSSDIRLDPKYFLAKDEYIADEVARYLSQHDIALLDTGWNEEYQYKLFILE